MNKPQQAKDLFSQGYNCAQAVIGAYCEELGLSKDVAFKLSTGLGSGMRCGEVCGAVSGALIIIGLKHGYGVDGKPQNNEITNELVAKFEDKFLYEHGSLLCKDILTYDLSKEDELKILRENNMFDEVCPDVVISLFNALIL